MNEDAATARRMWVLFETYHDVTFFTPESRAATDALGCKGGWMGYFGMRAAPFGAASPEQVTSAFFSFHPARVARALPEAWQIASPETFLRTRLEGAGAALTRMLGQPTITGAPLAEAAALATRAAANADTAARPLAAANAALPLPEEPHLALWQATTTLRESRGDAHLAALVAADLDPPETLVLFAADTHLEPAYLRTARGWPEQDWTQAQHRLHDRGLITEQAALTEAGAALRADIEARTDAAAARPWQALGREHTDRLAILLTPMARVLAATNDAMRQNPMALNASALIG